MEKIINTTAKFLLLFMSVFGVFSLVPLFLGGYVLLVLGLFAPVMIIAGALGIFTSIFVKNNDSLKGKLAGVSIISLVVYIYLNLELFGRVFYGM